MSERPPEDEGPAESGDRGEESQSEPSITEEIRRFSAELEREEPLPAPVDPFAADPSAPPAEPDPREEPGEPEPAEPEPAEPEPAEPLEPEPAEPVEPEPAEADQTEILPADASPFGPPRDEPDPAGEQPGPAAVPEPTPAAEGDPGAGGEVDESEDPGSGPDDEIEPEREAEPDSEPAEETEPEPAEDAEAGSGVEEELQGPVEEEAPAPEEEIEPEEEPSEATAEQESVPPPPAAPATAAPPARPLPPRPLVEPVPEPPRSGLLARFVAGSIVIVTAMAAATAVSVLLYLTDIASGLAGNERFNREIAGELEGLDDPSGPQTILVLGSDKRAGDETERSDTALLLRLDPDRNAIALFSLPRDLKVDIPGIGVRKLNEAYLNGGPRLAAKTISDVTGLEINHLVNINFQGFADAVDAIDCVYVDVDREYFNPPGTGYAEIDVNAGYQRLCGLKALQFVRFRHTDNDLVRAARQQDFLREARQKVPVSRLIDDRNELIDIFTEYTTSDIDSGGDVLEMLELFYALREAPVREVHFQGNLGTTFVTASSKQMKQAVAEFLGTEGTEGPRGGKAAGGGSAEKEEKKKKKSGGRPDAELVDSGSFVLRFARTSDRRLENLPVYYPALLPPDTLFDSDSSRQYEIKGPREGGKRRFYKAYKMVLYRPGAGGFNEYFGVMGTRWEDPPILENPSETRELGGREYQLYYDGDRLRMVAWKTGRGSWWLNNTLLQSLEEDEMLGIAESVRRYRE